MCTPTEHVFMLLDGETYAHPETLQRWSTWKHPVTGDNVAHYLGAPLGPVPQHVRDTHALRVQRVLENAQHLLSTPNAMGVMPMENSFWEIVKETLKVRKHFKKKNKVTNLKAFLEENVKLDKKDNQLSLGEFSTGGVFEAFQSFSSIDSFNDSESDDVGKSFHTLILFQNNTDTNLPFESVEERNKVLEFIFKKCIGEKWKDHRTSLDTLKLVIQEVEQNEDPNDPKVRAFRKLLENLRISLLSENETSAKAMLHASHGVPHGGDKTTSIPLETATQDFVGGAERSTTSPYTDLPLFFPTV